MQTAISFVQRRGSELRVMTREEALNKAAVCLEKAEQSINVEHWQKYVNVAQLYLTLAHESRND